MNQMSDTNIPVFEFKFRRFVLRRVLLLLLFLLTYTQEKGANNYLMKEERIAEKR